MLIPQALRIVALDLDGTLLRSDSTIVTHSGSNFVEVAAAGVTKALALAQYCEEARHHGRASDRCR
jgi:hydroxymethylpyrimidine pyrophosphatase-like HAD family hydrolase